jgi:DNA-binding response OmpR family regulator
MGGRAPLILVADDDADVLELVQLRLTLAGYEVLTARTGEEALASVRESAPALAVLDVTMPGLGGLEVTEAIRAEEETRSMPVILLSARVSDADVERGLGSGADEYMKKPFDPKDLRDRVGALLEISSGRPEALGANSP